MASLSKLVNDTITITLIAEIHNPSVWKKGQKKNEHKFCKKCLLIRFHRDVSQDAVRNAHLEKMPGFKLTWKYVGVGMNRERYFYKKGGSKGLTKAFVR